MTKNQIDYWTFRELERSNLAKEAETKRANLAQEQEKHRANIQNEAISLYDVAEKQRHNTEQENYNKEMVNYNLMSLDEQARHNTVTEGEAFRHNQQTEGIQYYSAGAQNLSAAANMAAVSESARHNLAAEMLTSESNTNEFMKIQNDYAIKKYQQGIDLRKIQETERSNLIREAETERANRAREKNERVRIAVDGIAAGIRSVGSLASGIAAAGLI